MQKRKKSYPISVEELKVLWKKKNKHLSVIDIRSQIEYTTGRIPGATSIPLGKLMQHRHDLKKPDAYVLYSQNGNRSYTAANWLAGEGFENIYHLKGGLNSWQGFQAHGHIDLHLAILPPNASFFEALQMAIALEENLKQLYLDLADHCTDKKILSIVKRLIKFEDHHKAHLMAQYEVTDEDQLKLDEFKDKHGEKLEGGGELEGARKSFSKMIQKPEDILKIGIALEAQALDFYSRLAQKSVNDQNRQLFSNMMKEELVHLEYVSRELEKFLVNSINN